MDLSATIIPKSDQLNADDLITGPITVTVDRVVVKGGNEQPVDIHLIETPGRCYRPSKSMRRVLVKAWGKESDNWPRPARMTLYRDPDVKFGGQKVGGIKISHMSHIEKPFTMALTETQSKRTPHTVEPLPDTPTPPARLTKPQYDRIGALMKEAGLTAAADARAYVCARIGRDVQSSRDLTPDEADQLIAALEQLLNPAVDVAQDDTTGPLVGGDET